MNEPETHDSVVNVAESDAGKFDHVDFDATRAQVIEKRFDQLVGFMVEKESSVKQIDTGDSDGFLLQFVFCIEHSNVNDDLAILVAWVGLEADPHPAVAVVCSFEISGRDSIGKGEKGSRIATAFPQPFEVQRVFVL